MKVFWRVLLGLLLVLVTVGTASAHAKLIKATPAPSSISPTAPSQVEMTFDEDIDLNFSQVQVLDSQKQRVDAGTLQAVPGDSKSFVVPLKTIGDGTYNVIWKVLSATDGHITSGVFAFGVGNNVSALPSSSDLGANTTPNELTPLSAIVRWLTLISLLTLVGGLFFRTFLLDRSLRAIDASKNVRKAATRRWMQLTIVAFVVFFAAMFVELALQANLVLGDISFTSIWTILSGSRYGQLWYLGVGLIAGCAVGLFIEARRGKIPQAQYLFIILAALALYMRSLESHAASDGNFTIQVMSDWLHLFCVSIWVGGLFCFAWLMPTVWKALDPKSRSTWIAWIVPHFSWIALPATVVIAITGIYNSTQQIPALNIPATGTLPNAAQLTQDTYTDALFIKVGLFIVMIGFGALNLLFLSPRFRRYITEPDKSAKFFSRFRITVMAEVVLGLAAILFAGMLTLSTPPRSEPTQLPSSQEVAQAVQPIILEGNPAPDVKVHLTIGPNPDNPSNFDALVTDTAGKALPDLQRVIFQFMYLQQDTGAQQVIGTDKGGNHFAADGNLLPLDGMWQIKLTVRRRGLDDQTIVFPYYIAPKVANSTAQAPDAQAQLVASQQKMNALTSLRSTQNLNDGSNGVVVSLYDYQAPDKTKFQIVGQGDSIAIGSAQYYQDASGKWTEQPRVEDFTFPSFTYASTAQATMMGRTDTLNGVPAHIVLFDTPDTSGDALIHYAYWLADDDKRLLQLGMVTDAHYMIQTYQDFNSPQIAIAAPDNVLPTPTAVPAIASGTDPLAAAVQGTGRPKGFITGDLEGDGALVMVVVGVVVLLIGSGGKRTRNARLVTLGLGAAAVVLGIGLFVDAVNGTVQAAQNVPINTERATSGQVLYQQNCAVCHGPKGLGDGPGGASLPVKPFDLTTHVLLHDEQYLYATILNGRGYMPTFGSRLSQDDILDLIAYTRLLARNAQQGGAGATPRPGFTPQP